MNSETGLLNFLGTGIFLKGPGFSLILQFTTWRLLKALVL